MEIAWGKKVSRTFVDRAIWIQEELGLHPSQGVSQLMACMGFESGGTFSANVKNAAGSGAVGLIQFMPKTAIGLGTTTDKLSKMTPEDQLNYVYKYFRPYKGRLKNLGDIYMAILWPGAIGKPDTHVLWDKESRPTTYLQNRGLDVNKDGLITRGECLVHINSWLTRGLLPENKLVI